MLSRYYCIHEFHVALLLHFEPKHFHYENFEQGQNKHCEMAIMMLHTHFFYDLEASTVVAAFATIYGALTKLLKCSVSMGVLVLPVCLFYQRDVLIP